MFADDDVAPKKQTQKMSLGDFLGDQSELPPSALPVNPRTKRRTSAKGLMEGARKFYGYETSIWPGEDVLGSLEGLNRHAHNEMELIANATNSTRIMG